MIRNRYNYLTPSVQDTKGTESNDTAIQTLQPFFFQNNGRTAIQNKIFHLDIHSKTYNDNNSKQQQKHRLGTVSLNLTAWGGMRGWGRGECVCGGGGA